MTPLVIDLSHHNTIPVSLAPVAAAGVIGVIHKCTQGTKFVDEKYPARRHLAREAGLLWGAYHWLSTGPVKNQLDHFLSHQSTGAAPGDKPTLLALDFEERGVSLSHAEEFAKLMLERMGELPVLYAGAWLKECLGTRNSPILSQCLLWLADYGYTYTLPPGWTRPWLRQYTAAGSMPGVMGNCDLNEGNREDVYRTWAGQEYGGEGKRQVQPPGEIVLSVPKGTPYRVVEV